MPPDVLQGEPQAALSDRYALKGEVGRGGMRPFSALTTRALSAMLPSKSCTPVSRQSLEPNGSVSVGRILGVGCLRQRRAERPLAPLYNLI